MHSNAIIFMGTAALGVMAAEVNLFPGHAIVRREVVARHTAGVPTPNTNDPCLVGLMSISKTLPTPAPDVLSALGSNTQTDVCSITVPTAVSDKFNAYTNTVLSWYSSNSAAINSILSQCPSYKSLAGQLPVCSTKIGSNLAASTASPASSRAAAITGGATAAGSAGAAGNSKNPTSSIASVTRTGAGPRETSIMVGALAAIGFLGVVAAL